MSGLCIPRISSILFTSIRHFCKFGAMFLNGNLMADLTLHDPPAVSSCPGWSRAARSPQGTAHSVLLRSDGRVVACGDNRAGKPSWERPFLGGVSGGGFMGEGIRILIVSVLSEVENDGNPSRLCERPTLESVQSLLPRPGNAMFRCSKMA